MPFAPVDGVYEIDTSGFASPVFQCQVACSTGDNCEVTDIRFLWIDPRVVEASG